MEHISWNKKVFSQSCRRCNRSSLIIRKCQEKCSSDRGGRGLHALTNTDKLFCYKSHCHIWCHNKLSLSLTDCKLTKIIIINKCNALNGQNKLYFLKIILYLIVILNHFEYHWRCYKNVTKETCNLFGYYVIVKLNLM